MTDTRYTADQLLAACPRNTWFSVPEVVDSLDLKIWNRNSHIRCLINRLSKEKKWSDLYVKDVVVENHQVRWCI